MKPIHLHPFSYPDELHASQGSRYHFHSGNRDKFTTFNELYGTHPFRMSGAIPRNIQHFATRLPGNSSERFVDLLNQNTLAPLLEIFNGASIQQFTSSPPKNSAHLLFRRVVGELGKIRLCLECIKDDTASYGESYIHRSHQIPGTSCCFKHGLTLVTKCPACHQPFEAANHLNFFWAPWQRCRCGSFLHEQNIEKTLRKHSIEEVALARFGMELLNSPTKPVTPAVLVETYRIRLIEMGLNNKSVIDRIGLQQALVEYYGEQVLASVDYALRAQKQQMWLRLTARSGSADTPMPRHLLVANFLFGTSTAFQSALKNQQVLHDVEPKAWRTKTKSKQVIDSDNGRFNKEPKVKQDIRKEIELHPEWTLDDLWLNRRKLMTSLFKAPEKEQSLKWLHKLIATSKSANCNQHMLPHVDDESWASKIEETAKNHYQSVDRPIKLTKNYLLRCVNWRKPRSPDLEEYPLTVAKLEVMRESGWHYNARKVMWSRIVYGTPEMPAYRICELVRAEYHRGIDLVSIFSPMPFNVAIEPGVVMKWLCHFNIPLNWAGPQKDYYDTGRKYVRGQQYKHPRMSEAATHSNARGCQDAP